MITSRSYGVPPTNSNLMIKTPLMIQSKKEIGTTSTDRKSNPERGKMKGGRSIEPNKSEVKRKQTGGELWDIKERYQAIFDRSLDCLYVVDFEGNFMDANPAALSLLGYQRADIPLLNISFLLHADSISKGLKDFNEIIQTGFQKEVSEYKLCCKNGKFVYVETQASIIYHDNKPHSILGIARDITERKRVEADLYESEERYRNLVEKSFDGIFIQKGPKVIFANNRLYKMLGYQYGELAGLDHWLVYHPDDQRVTRERADALLRGDDVLPQYEVKLQRKDGTSFTGEILACAIMVGNEPGIQVWVRDITERKRVEEVLEKERQDLKLIIDSSPIIVFYKDKEGKFIRVNKTFAETQNMHEEDLVGKTVFDLCSPQIAQGMTVDDQEVFQSRRPKFNIIELYESARGKRWVQTDKIPIFDKHGMPTSLIGFAQDITDRKQAEEALRESEEKYRTILENIEEGYYEMDLAGNFIFFNDALIRIHEYSRDEMMGMNYRQYTDTENAKNLYRDFNRVYRTEELSKSTEYEVISKNEARKSVESSVSLIRDFSGKPIGFRGIARDITELKRVQTALVESEDRYRDLVESSRDLITIHDLKGKILWVNEEPIRILGYKKDSFLKMNVRDLLVFERKEEFDEYLATIKSQGIASGLMTLQTAKGGRRVLEYHNTLRTEGVPEPIVRSVARDVTERVRAENEVKETVIKLRKAMGGIIQAMVLTIESRDPYTAGHQKQVSNLARTIAQEMDLSQDQIEAVRMAGMVHDLGKVSVPAEILSKPTQLSSLEFSLIKAHPQTSYNILKDIDFPWPIARIALQHHERINGSGYPLGLKGDEILIEARVLMVADVVEAIASHRPYRPAYGIDKALEEISKNKGILYDPEVVGACLRLFKEKGFKLK